MTKRLKFWILSTDILLMLYWLLAGLMVGGLLDIPAEYMYANYENAAVIAWNWSFFWLDVMFSVFGFIAVSRAGKNDPTWRVYAIMSLVLTMAAGGMAIAYWTILREFDPAWYLSNLILLVWPIFFLPSLIGKAAPLTPDG